MAVFLALDVEFLECLYNQSIIRKIKQNYYRKKYELAPVGAQKISLLHKAGGRVVPLGKRHQRKVEKGFLKRKKNSKFKI